MQINRKIEKMFIEQQNKFDLEIENVFYQKEVNTYDYYELEEKIEVIDATITNCYACEFYLSHAYKYLREYLRINNSLLILGAIKDDPKLIVCIELIKSLTVEINKLKAILMSYYIYSTNSITYKPCRVPNQTLQITTYYSNLNKSPKTPELMFELVIKSLYRAELCFESIDYLLSHYFEFHNNESINDEYEKQIEQIYENLLDNYLEFKMSHLMLIDI